MLLVAKEFTKPIKEGTQDIKELAEWLMKNNSAWEIACSLAELMCTIESQQPKKIVVSEEEMRAITNLFRIRGYSESGEKISQGRPRKKDD